MAPTQPALTSTESISKIHPSKEYFDKAANANLFASNVAPTEDSQLSATVGWKLTWRRVILSAPYQIVLVCFTICSVSLFIFALVVMDNDH